MAVVQGYTQKVMVRSDATAATDSDEIAGILSVDVEETADLEESTTTKANDGYKTRQTQLKDVKITLNGQFDSSDTQQGILRSALASGASVYITVQTDPAASAGSKGFRYICLVSSVGKNVDPNKAGAMTVTCEGNGAPTAV
jgi:hypothetical protein